MKKYRFLIMIAAFLLVFSACGSSSSVKYNGEYASAANTFANAPQISGYGSDSFSVIDAGASYEYKTPLDAVNSETGYTTSLQRDNTKVIYNANASIETSDFESTCSALRQLTKDLGGYMESEDVSNSSSTGSISNRRASFVVRIPSENYEQFVTGMGDGCKVISIKQTKDDVGAEYFDVEQKLETLNNKHDRLEALLEKADNMEDIIALENALSDTEYEINRYKGTLNMYDSLINFSTINISLREVAKPGEGIDEDPGFFARLGRNFADGFDGFTNALENLAYWLSYNLLTIIVIVVIIVAIVKIHPICRIKKAVGKNRGEVAKAEEKQ